MNTDKYGCPFAPAYAKAPAGTHTFSRRSFGVGGRLRGNDDCGEKED